MNFGLLEGGVAWAATLLNDIVEHFEKRNVDALLENLDPGKLDIALLAELADRWTVRALTGERVRQRPHSPVSRPIARPFSTNSRRAV